MIENIIEWFILTVATERSAEIIVSSKLFEPLRMSIKRWTYPLDQMPSDTIYQNFKVMIDYLMTCGYCVSVWMGFFYALFAPQVFSIWIVNWFITGVFLHGLANFYHVVYELARRGRVNTHDLVIKIKDDDGEEGV